MRRIVLAAVMAGVLVSLLGCNPRLGLIVLDTYPQGATVYVNENKIGETPVKFEFNMERPALLRIMKEGYQPHTEHINVGWIKSEYYQGHYGKGEFILEGKMQRGYQVVAKRDLVRLEGQTALPPPPPPPVVPIDCGEPVVAPAYQVGERWTWRDAQGKERIAEVTGLEGETTQIRWPSGDIAFYDKDRILRKVYRLNGEVLTTQGDGAYREIGQKTLDFPLVVGKQWEYRYTTPPSATQTERQTYIQSYKVVACEDVTTPAGRFPAFKIEIKQGLAAGGPSGIYYLWWAPEVKWGVRRQFVPSTYWTQTNDGQLVKYERK